MTKVFFIVNSSSNEATLVSNAEIIYIILSDQSQQDSGPFSPVTSKRGFGIGSMVRKAASVASVAAKNAYAAAASSHSFDEEMIPLKCCLMSISLPWEHIACDLLFKVRLFPCANELK